MLNNRDPNIGFDSLLDTMTNVVGILIIVLSITYLVVMDIVDHVAKFDQRQSTTTIDEYQKLQAESKQLDTLLNQVKREWKETKKNAQYIQAQLNQIHTKSEILSNGLSKDDSNQINTQKIDRWLQINRNRVKQLNEKIDLLSKKSELAQHSINLQRELPKPKITIARVPDPVPAPKGAERISFLCRYGQIVFYPANKMTKLLYKGIAEATGTDSSNPKITMNDFTRIIEHFNNHEVSLKGLRWRVKAIQWVDSKKAVHRDLRAILEWGFGVGETLEDIQKDTSQYRKILAEYANKHVYAKYYVWGDSFPEYTIARKIIDENHVPAGWVAKEGAADYVLALSSFQTSRKKGTLVNSTRAPSSGVYRPGRIGFGSGVGNAPTRATAGGGSFGIVGSSPGGDFVD